MEALPTVVLVLEKRACKIAFANPSAEADARTLAQATDADPRGRNCSPMRTNWSTTIASIADHRFTQRIWTPCSNVRAASRCMFMRSSVSGRRTNYVLLELFENERHMKTDREERINDLTAVNKQLIRNLAHEIKNPLGGIRGAAQLLEFELGARERDELREYTQVIIKESDRLQTLVDRLLEPHRHPHIVGDVNIHEVCERVRAVILAEFPRGLTLDRDYDVSVPDLRGDKEQLIQALLKSCVTRRKRCANAFRKAMRESNCVPVLRAR